MELQIKPLRRADCARAASFAVRGMHFSHYTDSSLELRLYGRYFLCDELRRATHVLAAYAGDELAGVLMADLRGAPKAGCALGQRAFLALCELVMRASYRDSFSAYDHANAAMYRRYVRRERPDGEICFLAADPEHLGQGVGSFLLDELRRRAPGKRVYLYTDDNCSYPFYERRGFQRQEEQTIELPLRHQELSLRCFLYSAVL